MAAEMAPSALSKGQGARLKVPYAETAFARQLPMNQYG